MSRKVQHDIGFVAAIVSWRLFRLLRAGRTKELCRTFTEYRAQNRNRVYGVNAAFLASGRAIGNCAEVRLAFEQ